MVRAFCAEVDVLVTGNDGHGSLLQLCRPAYQKLKCGILGTAPDFRPFEDASKDVKEARFHIDKEDALHPSRETSPIYLEDVRSHTQGYAPRDVPHF